MNSITRISLASLVLAAAAAGCHTGAPPPRVAVPRSYNEGGAVMTYPHLKPLPPAHREQDDLPPLTIDDPPLVTQAPPEQPAFLDAYAHVMKPRIAVFVNRSIDGKLVPVNDPRQSVGGLTVTGTGGWMANAELYLTRGQYDDAQAQAIDYQAIELTLTDLLSANGRVTIMDPTMVRQRLTDEEVKDLQAGRPQALREAAERLDVDVLVQAQARPTKQSADGLAIRILVEALNTKGGESIARAFVDMPPPLDKPAIMHFTRFLARKTMYELTSTWTTMSANDDRRPGEPATRP